MLPASSKKSKGKGKPKDPHASARAILSDMEEGVQCPMYVLIVSVASVGIDIPIIFSQLL